MANSVVFLKCGARFSTSHSNGAPEKKLSMTSLQEKKSPVSINGVVSSSDIAVTEASESQPVQTREAENLGNLKKLYGVSIPA
jgi:hypothetical protein